MNTVQGRQTSHPESFDHHLCNLEFHTLKAPRALDINWDGHGFSFGRFGNNQTNNCQPLRLGVSSNGGRTSSKCHIGDQMMLFLISLLGSSPAAAFCGTFVGGVGSEFYNSYSQAAMVRSGQQTTLTVQNDVLGEFSDFALVMPVTQVLPETAIKVIDPSVFDSIDTYSMPRLVSYTCDDFEDQSDTGWAFDSANDGPPSEPNVSVEAQYIVGEYEVVILSASESEGLFDWLNGNGYQVPGQSIPLLQEYIDSGQFFLAAKVSDSAGIESGDLLSPLQLTYECCICLVD